jgi:hypothetical protein
LRTIHGSMGPALGALQGFVSGRDRILPVVRFATKPNMFL